MLLQSSSSVSFRAECFANVHVTIYKEIVFHIFPTPNYINRQHILYWEVIYQRFIRENLQHVGFYLNEFNISLTGVM